MVTLLVLNAGALLTALLAARRARGGGTHRALATLSGAVIVIHSVMLAAGLLGWLTVAGVSAALMVAAAAAAALARGPRQPRHACTATTRFSSLALFTPLAAVVAGVLWLRPHLVQATRLWIWDDYTYHMVYPVLWLREHAIAAATPAQAFTMQAWYPLSASVVAAWFMLPFAGARGDALAWVSLTGPLYAGIVACGAAELLGRLGCRRGAWALPVVVLATSQRIGVMASSFSDADLATAALLFGASVFAIPRDGETPRDVVVDTWYAGLLSGLAIGVKVSAAPQALVILAMTAWRAGSRRGAVRAVISVAVAWMATGGYWYARNVAHTGNPVYPAAFLIWPGATFPMTTLREYSAHYGLARTVRDALTVYMNWPWLHAMLAVAGLGRLSVWLLARWRAATRAQICFACGTLAMAAVTLVLLPATPYSAGNGMTFVSGFIHWDSMRYVALLPILGWVSLGFVLDAGAGAPRIRASLATAVAASVLLVSGAATPGGVAALALGAILMALVPMPRLPAPLVAGAAGLALAVMVVGSHHAKAAATADAFYREPLFGGAAAALDRQPPGTRIAVFGDQWVYPLFGARHDLRPVRLDADGRVATAPIADAMEPGPLTVAAPSFRANLAASAIDVVAIVHLPHPGRSPQWPSQHAALEALPDARLLYRDAAVALWRLTPARD